MWLIQLPTLTCTIILNPFYNFQSNSGVTAHQTGKKPTSSDVIWHLTKEVASAEIEDNINKSNAAMLTAHWH
jgi:hypothetical protein